MGYIFFRASVFLLKTLLFQFSMDTGRLTPFYCKPILLIDLKLF